MKIALSPLEKLRAAGKFLDVTFNKRPLTVSIEVTKRCNARCDFCDYWKISDRDEMTDFTDVVRRFDPLVVVFTGGEPMLRRDLVPLVRQIKELPGFRYITVLTHGGFLTEAKIEELVEIVAEIRFPPQPVRTGSAGSPDSSSASSRPSRRWSRPGTTASPSRRC